MSTQDRITGTTPGALAGEHTNSPQYEIRVRGLLGARWTAWFDGLSLSTEDDGTTAIRGPVVDQAALHGLLQKVRDLGLPLVSVRPLPLDTTTPGNPAPADEGN